MGRRGAGRRRARWFCAALVAALVAALGSSPLEARAEPDPPGARAAIGDEMRAPEVLAGADTVPFAPRARGWVLESGFGLGLASTQLTGTTSNLRGSVFAGYKIGPWMWTLGAEVSSLTLGTRLSNGFAGAPQDSGGSLVEVMLVPGVRVPLWHAPDGRFELGGELDFGFGRTFGVSGPGADTQLGLPTGTQVTTENFRAFVALGPVVRYWVHPRLAVEAAMLGRGDLASFQNASDTPRHQLDANLLVALRLLMVF